MNDPMTRAITYGEKYDPAMLITDRAEADAYLERCVAHTMGFGRSREDATRVERENLGYWAGYYGPEVRARVLAMFDAPHPIFGTRDPTPEEAIEAGRLMAISANFGW